MKLCKDCSNYSPRQFVKDSGSNLGWSPEWCAKKIGEPDPVSGVFVRAGDPAAAREDESKCGKEARWFEPGTLDGRLSMLDEPSPPVEEIEHSGD